MRDRCIGIGEVLWNGSRAAMVVGTLFLMGVSGCPGSSKTLWVPFNADDESLMVEVVAGEELGDVISRDLNSTTGQYFVGTASVDPGSGPVGTDHQVWVVLEEDYADTVGRVSLVTDSDSRGLQEHELRQDSADYSTWQVSVTSLGEEGEDRSDTFTFMLWQEAEEGDTGAVEGP